MEDLDKAKAFTASDDLRQAMEKAGVIVKPDVYFLKKEKGAELTIDTKWTILSRHFRQQSLNFIHIPSTETDFNLKE